jgi:hypothetical protein
VIDRLAASSRALIAALVGQIPGAEERRKRTFLIMALLILIPALLGYGTAYLVHGRLVDAIFPLGLAVFLAGAIAWCRRLASTVPVMRVIFVGTLAVVLRVIVTGSGGGFAFLWAYLLPVWSFVVFGTVEGRRWVSLFYLSVAVALWAAPVAYETAMITRFLVTVALVAVFAYAIESSRSEASRELQREKVALEGALAHIRTLSGLIPICASCHRIRDDRGSWSELEHYLASRVDVQFTHGLCPGCLEHSKREIKELLDKRQQPQQAQALPTAARIQPP